MRRTLACLNKTINLADKCCGKTTLLVYEKSGKPPVSHPDCPPRPHISVVPTKKIKICTGAELKKMCRPTPCVCPPPLSKFGTFLELLYRAVLFGVKSAILGSVVYYTWEAGIWGDSEDTERFYSSICHLFSDSPKQKKKFSAPCRKQIEIRNLTPTPPSEDECKQPPINNAKLIYRVQQSWNHTVTTCFLAIAQFPDNAKQAYQKLIGEENEKKCKNK